MAEQRSPVGKLFREPDSLSHRTPEPRAIAWGVPLEESHA